MSRTTKRILSLTICLALLMSFTSVMALAAEQSVDSTDPIYWYPYEDLKLEGEFSINNYSDWYTVYCSMTTEVNIGGYGISYCNVYNSDGTLVGEWGGSETFIMQAYQEYTIEVYASRNVMNYPDQTLSYGVILTGLTESVYLGSDTETLESAFEHNGYTKHTYNVVSGSGGIYSIDVSGDYDYFVVWDSNGSQVVDMWNNGGCVIRMNPYQQYIVEVYAPSYMDPESDYNYSITFQRKEVWHDWSPSGGDLSFNGYYKYGATPDSYVHTVISDEDTDVLISGYGICIVSDKDGNELAEIGSNGLYMETFSMAAGQEYYFSVRCPGTSGANYHLSFYYGITLRRVAYVNDMDSGVAFTGDWTYMYDYNNEWNLHEQDQHYSNQPGAYAEFSFEGTAVRWIDSVADNRGLCDIYIDGQYITRVSQYSDTYAPQQELFSRDSLEDGQHTLKIVVTGQKEPTSTDNYICIDAFEFA